MSLRYPKIRLRFENGSMAMRETLRLSLYLPRANRSMDESPGLLRFCLRHRFNPCGRPGMPTWRLTCIHHHDAGLKDCDSRAHRALHLYLKRNVLLETVSNF